MAFNPFHKFRKHQKVVFAILTIICMLTFVLAGSVTGRGDFFSELAHWFGLREPKVALGKIHGRTVEIPTFVLWREQRNLANLFMGVAVATAHQKIISEAKEKVQEFDQTYQRSVDQVRNNMQMAVQLAGTQYASLIFDTQQFMSCQRMLGFLEEKLGNDKKPTEQQRIRRVRSVIEREYWNYQNRDQLYAENVPYFGGSLGVEGIMDFQAWKREADNLGIHLSVEDVQRLVGQETLDSITPEEANEILNRVASTSRAASVDIMSALADEFRVRAAQAALLGYDSGGITQPPALITPHELWDYYRKNRSQLSVKLLPLPVSKFLDKVTSLPPEREIVNLYDRFRDVERNPASDKPGFMQARRVKIQWAAISQTGETYKKGARHLLLAQLGQFAARPAVPAIAAMLPLLAADTYQRLKHEGKWNFLETSRLTDASFALPLYTHKTLTRAESVASTLALAAPAGPSVLGSFVSLSARAVIRESADLSLAIEQERQKRVPLAVAMFGTGSGIGAGPASAGPWLHAGHIEQHVPLEVVKDEVVRRMDDQLTRRLAEYDIADFRNGLEEIRKENAGRRAKLETASAAYVQRELARRKWKTGSSTEARDRFTIAGDPGLKPFLDYYLAPSSPFLKRKAKDFANLFVREGDKADASKLYTVETEQGEEESYIHWKIADIAPEVLPLDKARPEVLAAWRFDKARALAEAEANRIAAEARKTKDPIPNLTEAAKGDKLLEIDGISRLTQGLSPLGGRTMPYQPYRVPEDKIEYTNADFINKILELKQVGDVAVVADAPRSIYYVAALTHRSEPLRTEFLEAQLLPTLEQERRRQYRLDYLRELRVRTGIQIDEEGRKAVEESGRRPSSNE